LIFKKNAIFLSKIVENRRKSLKIAENSHHKVDIWAVTEFVNILIEFLWTARPRECSVRPRRPQSTTSMPMSTWPTTTESAPVYVGAWGRFHEAVSGRNLRAKPNLDICDFVI
jgi:hypothetical protein